MVRIRFGLLGFQLHKHAISFELKTGFCKYFDILYLILNWFQVLWKSFLMFQKDNLIGFNERSFGSKVGNLLSKIQHDFQALTVFSNFE